MHFHYLIDTNMGAKKNKIKRILSPQSANEPPTAEPDDDLLDDLMAQLDSSNKAVQNESAHILNELQSTQMDEARDKSSGNKKDSKARHQARQVSHNRDCSSSNRSTDHSTGKKGGSFGPNSATDRRRSGC